MKLKGLSARPGARTPSRAARSEGGDVLAEQPETVHRGRAAAMIVRILGEGQYDVSDEALDRLNELDAAVETAVEAGDEAAFGTALAALLDGVRTVGVAHDVDSLDESDLILPPSDATIDEVRELLAEPTTA